MMGYDEVEEINTLIEELGVDAEDLQGPIAWAMDLYDHGIITKNDLRNAQKSPSAGPNLYSFAITAPAHF